MTIRPHHLHPTGLPPVPRPWRVATTAGTLDVEATTAAQAILSALELAGPRAQLIPIGRVGEW